MTQTFLQEVKEELQKGATKKDHAFRYFTLATVGLDQVARLRTIVLRKIEDDLRITFFTDSRSKKMIHLQENKKVGLLFYDSKKLMQIRIEGMAKVIRDAATKEKYWKDMSKSSKKEYTSATAPGTAIATLGKIEYLEDHDHFCVVEITPFKIEYLKLQRPPHIRVRYSWEVDRWEGELIVP